MIIDKEFVRLFKQAKHNSRSAKSDAEDESFDWACFKAQQSEAILFFIKNEFEK